MHAGRQVRGCRSVLSGHQLVLCLGRIPSGDRWEARSLPQDSEWQEGTLRCLFAQSPPFCISVGPHWTLASCSCDGACGCLAVRLLPLACPVNPAADQPSTGPRAEAKQMWWHLSTQPPTEILLCFSSFILGAVGCIPPRSSFLRGLGGRCVAFSPQNLLWGLEEATVSHEEQPGAPAAVPPAPFLRCGVGSPTDSPCIPWTQCPACGQGSVTPPGLSFVTPQVSVLATV